MNELKLESMPRELITIVTVCYNAEQVIEGTLRSVLHQTYERLEYIVVDGKSSDGTCRIVKEYEPLFIEKGFTFRFVSERDRGIYDAMNKAIGMATGKWINFMNAGDSFCTPDVIERVFDRTIPHDVKAVYGNAVMIKKSRRKHFMAQPPHVILKGMVACHQAIFADVQDMKAHPFSMEYKIVSDFHYMYQLYKRSGKFLPVPVDVADYEAENGVSSVRKLANRLECAKITGKRHTWQWKVEITRKAFEIYTEQFLRDILPEDWFYKLQQWNYGRLERRYARKMQWEFSLSK